MFGKHVKKYICCLFNQICFLFNQYTVICVESNLVTTMRTYLGIQESEYNSCINFEEPNPSSLILVRRVVCKLFVLVTILN